MLRNATRVLPLVSAVFLPLLGCSGGAEPTPPGAAQTVNVEVTPPRVEVAPRAEVTFGAVVTGTANTSVAWAVQETTGGSITTGGLYTAPASGGTFHVTATSVADPTKQGSATVTVTPPAIVVAVTPSTGSLNACRTLQFTASVTGAANTAVTWSVQEGTAGGTISAAGLYTAPSGPGTYHVVATSVADPTKSAIATVTVNEVILAVAVTPSTVTLAPGGTAQFTATVTNTCGTFTSTSTITANGTISAN